jgi:hypothetical protein
MNLTVGSCGANGYPNEPCVSVTICATGTDQCQTINNILLDTGSFGLRLFGSLITKVSLPQVDHLYECAQFADGSSDWGPVKTADVILGGLRASKVPIHVIDKSSSASIPSTCADPDDSPVDAGFNGILGVGLFDVDCNTPSCPSGVGLYYSCDASGCTDVAVPVAKQVTNPVAMLPSDNNGVILRLPSVAQAGSGAISGQLVLGIGTRANNTVAANSVSYFPADGNGNFTTTFNGQSLSGSFIDSGSNGLFFPAPSGLTSCASNSNAYGFYCPASTMNYSAVQRGASGPATKTVAFSVINASTFVSSNNVVSPALGGSFGGVFDWGLPFFLGRNVFIGIDQKNSNLGTGPYWAH